jgi:hypothetical protein
MARRSAARLSKASIPAARPMLPSSPCKGCYAGRGDPFFVIGERTQPDPPLHPATEGFDPFGDGLKRPHLLGGGSGFTPARAGDDGRAITPQVSGWPGRKPPSWPAAPEGRRATPPESAVGPHQLNHRGIQIFQEGEVVRRLQQLPGHQVEHCFHSAGVPVSSNQG